jgi:hypothetical protein
MEFATASAFGSLLPCEEQDSVKSWEIIADDLSNAGWSWGCVSAVDSQGRTIWIADAHRGGTEKVLLCVPMKN